MEQTGLNLDALYARAYYKLYVFQPRLSPTRDGHVLLGQVQRVVQQRVHPPD